MALDLPKAVARVLPTRVRIGKTIHVTTLFVNAILATGVPSAFAGQAPTSFLFDQHTDSIAPAVNAYYEGHEGDAAKEYRLSESEWSAVSHFFERLPYLRECAADAIARKHSRKRGT